MTLSRFLAEGEPTWGELQSLVDAAGTRPTTLGSTRLLRMGTLYRAVTADLAQARNRFPGDPIVQRLETLALRSRGIVYSRTRKRLTVRQFYGHRYWQLIVERGRLLALAVAALVLPIIVGYLAATANPEAIRGVIPGAFLWVTQPQPAGTDIGLDAVQLAEFSFEVLVNNIQVTILAFALGILLGVVTIALMAYNGFLFGVVAALAIDAGNGALLVEAVIAHGVLELSCIIVGGLAGLRLAAAVINPGLRPRRVALVEEAGPAALLAIGTAPFLVLAGFVEGYVSRTGTTALPAMLIGVAIGGAYWMLAVVLGTRQKRTLDLASR